MSARKEPPAPVTPLHSTDVSEIQLEPSAEVPSRRSITERSERAHVSPVVHVMLCTVEVTLFACEALPSDDGTSYESTCVMVPG